MIKRLASAARARREADQAPAPRLPEQAFPPLHTHHSLMDDIVSELHPWGTAGAPKEG